MDIWKFDLRCKLQKFSISKLSWQLIFWGDFFSNTGFSLLWRWSLWYPLILYLFILYRVFEYIASNSHGNNIKPLVHGHPPASRKSLWIYNISFDYCQWKKIMNFHTFLHIWFNFVVRYKVKRINISLAGSIQESKGMRVIFQKKCKKRLNIWKFVLKCTKFENILKKCSLYRWQRRAKYMVDE